MKKFALILVVLLSACQYFPSRQQQVAISCAGYSATLRTLTAANISGKLDATAQEAVGTSIRLTSPICTAETPPALDQAAIAAFNEAMLILSAQAQKAEMSK